MLRDLYLHSPSGEVTLVEIFEEGGKVTIIIGNSVRLDLERNSAYDLADALLMIANEADFNEKVEFL